MILAIATAAASPRRLSEATPGIAELSFVGATIANSNLGGYGPDTSGEQDLRFEGVGQTTSGFSIDLVVTAIDGYEPWNTDSTMINGQFGQINLRGERESTLQFCFEEMGSAGARVTLDAFTFVFHDFDNGGTTSRERLRVGGFSSYATSAELDPPVATQLGVSTLDDGRAQFYSTEKGVGGDNAQDPDDLTDLQKSRMFRISYENIDCVFMRFVVEIQTDNGADNDCMPPWGGSRPLTSKLAHTPPLTRSRPMPQQMGATSFFR